MLSARFLPDTVRFLLAAMIAACAAMVAMSGAAHAQTCVKLDDAEAPAMFDAFNAALATQHPDKVTRLFAVEALHFGHQSDRPRTGYMDIRDYYLYFLTGKPHAEISQRQVRAGCGFVIDEGVLEWRFGITGRQPITAHYFMLHQYGPGGWRIAHYHEVQIETPKPVAMARKPAVAGYLKRANVARRAAVARLPSAEPGLFDDYKPGIFRDGVPVFD